MFSDTSEGLVLKFPVINCFFFFFTEGELKLKVSKGLLGEDNNTQDQEAEKLKSECEQ